MANKRLAIIDGKSVFYRGYYAMPNLATDEGVSTGGVYGFATMALEVIRRLKPDYVAVAWDKPKTNIRRRLELYPQYKAGRKPAPEDFKQQIPILHELLKAFGWPLYELDDYEADDIMGTLALQADKAGMETLLITSDLDMLQLVGPRVNVYVLKTGLSNIELFSPQSFEAKYGLKVSQFLDLKALMGDSSDNIPGVPGVGQKTATTLLQNYLTLDGIYDNIELISPIGLKTKLKSGKDLAYLSKQLAAIWTNAPLKLDITTMDGSKADVKKLIDLLNKLQFRSLLRQLPEPLNSKISQDQNSQSSTNLNFGSWREIVESSDLSSIIFKNAQSVYISSWSEGAHGERNKVVTISFDGETTYVLRTDKLDKKQLAEFLENLPPLIGHNLKSVLECFIDLGVINLPRVCHDILIAAFILSSNRREQSLSDIARSELGYNGSSIDELDCDSFISNSPVISALLVAIYKLQQKNLKKIKAFTWLVENIEWPLTEVLARMEVVGIELDTAYLHSFSVEIDDMLSDVEQQIFGYSECEFNIASPSQLADILFNRLKLDSARIKKGKTGYSTAANELEKLSGVHPIIDLVSRYREIAKLKSTYVNTLPKQVDSASRVHTTFNLTVAQTGRLSSTDPNLQNIPTRTDLGRRIRSAFIAGKNKKLISADYSQFELRLAAVLANDQNLIDMFNRGADIHLMTAAEVFGRSPEDVTKQMRSHAKTINFGILYGMSPHGLSVATGMNRDQAISFIDKYKNLRRPLFDYMDHLLEQARDQGYVETLFGRRRQIPDISSRNFKLRSAAERAAINMPIQGTAADLMKLAMIKIEQYLKSNTKEARQLLQIHDSILIECPEAIATNLAKDIQNIMQEVYKLSVRLDVDVVIGNNWGEL